MAQMTIRLFSILLILICAFGAWWTCGNTGTSIGDDDDDDDDNDVDGDDDQAPDSSPPLPPNVDSPRTPTALTFQSISGDTEPGALVRIEGGAEEAFSFADANDGTFCIEVALVGNATNLLAVTAEDDAGNESDPTNINIQQIQNNVALLGSADAASTSHSETFATPEKGIDGNKDTYWANTTQAWYAEALRSPQWYGVKLLATETINQVDIWWAEDGYGIKFDVYYSTLDEPTRPHDNGWKDDYTLIAEEVNPSSGFSLHNEYDLSAALVDVRWVMLTLHESSNKNILLYKFQIVELEIYALESGETDPGCE
jgi:Bacterial Ig domain/F5/8 type C domain